MRPVFAKQCQQLKAEIGSFSDIFINDISGLPDVAPLKLLTLVREVPSGGCRKAVLPRLLSRAI
jgi:hypothetical protein